MQRNELSQPVDIRPLKALMPQEKNEDEKQVRTGNLNAIITSPRTINSNLDQQQESAIDLSTESERTTDHRTSERHQRSLNYRQTYDNLSVSDPRPNTPSTKQNTMQQKESSRPVGKRPLKGLTLQQKMNAINRVRDGESKAAVARHIGVPESTLRGWCKAEQKICTQLKYILTTSSSDKSDNNRSNFLSTSINQDVTMGMGSISRRKSSEASILDTTPKRAKLDTTLTSTAATFDINNISASAHSFLRGNNDLFESYDNFPANDQAIKSRNPLNNLYSFSLKHFLPETSFLSDYRNMHNSNDAIGSITTADMTSTSNVLVNVNRSPIITSTPKISKKSSGKENNQPLDTEEPTWNISRPTNNPMLTISASTSRIEIATSSKSPKGNKLDAIISRLHANTVPITPTCNTEKEIIFSNAANNNDNNVDHVNRTKNKTSPEFLLEFFIALSCCTKLLQWMENYGRSVCASEQIEQVRTILDTLTQLSKKIESEKITNSTSESDM